MEESQKDIHLNIETVTPDTEKDGQPNDQKHNHRPDQPIADDAEKAPISENPGSDDTAKASTPGVASETEEVTPESEEESPVAENAETETEEEPESEEEAPVAEKEESETVEESETEDEAPESEDETPESEEDKDGDHPASGIETVSP